MLVTHDQRRPSGGDLTGASALLESAGQDQPGVSGRPPEISTGSDRRKHTFGQDLVVRLYQQPGVEQQRDVVRILEPWVWLTLQQMERAFSDPARNDSPCDNAEQTLSDRILRAFP